jgi:hypothetical protein
MDVVMMHGDEQLCWYEGEYCEGSCHECWGCAAIEHSLTYYVTSSINGMDGEAMASQSKAGGNLFPH